jgi:hypothetical protein
MTTGAEDVTGILHNREMTQQDVPVQHKHAMNVLLDFIDFFHILGKMDCSFCSKLQML